MLHIWIAVTHLKSKLLFWVQLMITVKIIGVHTEAASVPSRTARCRVQKYHNQNEKRAFLLNELTESHYSAENKENVAIK